MTTIRLSCKSQCLAFATLLIFLCSHQSMAQENQTSSNSKNCTDGEHPFVYGNGSDMPFGDFDPLLNRSCGLVKRTVDWPSGDIKDNADIVSTPGECCKLCLDNENCKVWLFRACCNHCWLKSEIYEERPCDGVDCIGGIKPEHINDEDIRTNRTTCTPGSVVPEPKNDGRPDDLDILGAALFACKAVEGLLDDDSDCPTLRQEFLEENNCSRSAHEMAESLPQCDGWRKSRDGWRPPTRTSPLCSREGLTPAGLFHYYARLVCGISED